MIESALKVAKKMALKSSHSQFLHGAVLIRGGAVIAASYNKSWYHAERRCLDRVNMRARSSNSTAKGCTMLCIRLTKGGLLANSKPCPQCESILRANGIRVVLYSTEDRTIERMVL